ncbi:M28 family peptidase [Luteimonas padinae]|uniref:M28 family peptidase n=1 Tax=Luteimonas padinae TaxID=1714359 RepID=A0ABV6SVJ5_9GAMM
MARAAGRVVGLLAVASVLSLLVVGCSARSAVGQGVQGAGSAVDAISGDRLAEHLRVLASDGFEGRAPATVGEEKTVAYISGQFAEAGLRPAGDAGGWTQAVTLARTEIAGPVAASFTVGDGGAWSLVNGEDIALETLHPEGDVSLRGVPVVFAGFGITAAATYHLPVRGWMQRATAERLFAEAGLSFEAARREAQQAGFRGRALEGVAFSAGFAVKRSRITSHNVLGLLPGAGRADETVIVSGHWDSFGIGEPDETGDAIINGAVDNATAIASMLEIARVMAAGPAPARSVLFIALTAEESGLLGATHYAAHPLRPLATTAAAINMEMWSPDGPTRDISSWGLGKVSLERALEAAARAEGRTYSPDPELEAGFFYRADHFAFAQAGVPAITVGPGMDQLDGGVEGGRAARADYFARRYHQPGDEFDEGWDMRGPTADTAVVLRLVRDVAGSAAWPEWDAGSEFRAMRESTADMRAR